MEHVIEHLARSKFKASGVQRKNSYRASHLRKKIVNDSNKEANRDIDIEISKWFMGRRGTPEVTDCFEGWWPLSLCLPQVNRLFTN